MCISIRTRNGLLEVFTTLAVNLLQSCTSRHLNYLDMTVNWSGSSTEDFPCRSAVLIYAKLKLIILPDWSLVTRALKYLLIASSNGWCPVGMLRHLFAPVTRSAYLICQGGDGLCHLVFGGPVTKRLLLIVPYTGSQTPGTLSYCIC